MTGVSKNPPEKGDYVKKEGGDYTFAGMVLTKFTKLSGAERYVVENSEGVLHIFNASQLTTLRKRIRDRPTKKPPREKIAE